MEEKGNLMIDNMPQEPITQTCETCQSQVSISNTDYHQQYICRKLLQNKKSLQQSVIDEQLNAKSKLFEQPNNSHYNKHQKLHRTQQKQHIPQMQLISSFDHVFNKTQSVGYEELNEEENLEGRSEISNMKKPSKIKNVEKKEPKKEQVESSKLQSQSGLKKKELKILSRSQKNQIIEKPKIPSRSKFMSAAAPVRNKQSQISGSEVQCSHCSLMVPIEHIDDHQFNCGLQIKCQFCGLALQVTQIQSHQKTCEIKMLWEKEQHNHYSYKEEKYYKGEYDEDYERGSSSHYNGQSYSQFNYHDVQQDFGYGMNYQMLESRKKHKGLGNSKIAQLQFSSYRKNKFCHDKSSQNKEKQEKSSQNKQKQEQQQQPCSICYFPFEDSQTIIKLSCLHTYHPECVGKWFQTDDRCPMCKLKVE